MDKILKALDEGKIVLGVFLDLSKAFDTVDHSILLKIYLNMVLEVPLLNGWQITWKKDNRQYVFNIHCSSKNKVQY